MSTLTDNPSFTANEIYEIASTDEVEGAADGASFDGIGISNQPHQQLANRTALLKGRQDTNIANIGALQAFQALFKGSMGANGYAKIPFVDASRGLITAIVQWGGYFPSGGLTEDGKWQVTWPIAFPNGCVWGIAALANSKAHNDCGVLTMETVSLSVTSGSFMSDWDGTSARMNDGFYWIAIGF
jgi:Putative tail fiber protein gp53-like, C-terminal